MSCFQVRTDLALEAREGITDADGELRGVRVEEYRNEKSEVNITKVTIDTRNGAKAMGKPMGTYITLEAPGLNEPDEDYHREVSEELAEQIRLLLPDEKEEKSVLVVGLGNRDVTADALGPEVVDNLFINRHVVLEGENESHQQPGSRCDGNDRNGNRRDHQGCCGADHSGCGAGGGCSCGEKHKTAEPDHSDL